jgi:hypothetical protein
LLNGAAPKIVKNLGELGVWQVEALDSIFGQFPLKVDILAPDGSTKSVELKNLAHAIDELYGLLLTVAEDADASVQTGLRAILESIQTKIIAKQTADLVTAVSDGIGFDLETVPRTIKISVSPSAAGLDNKLQNQEIGDFLKPSEQQFLGSKIQSKSAILAILDRILEGAEITRAALFHPIKPKKNSKASEDIGVPGEYIKKSKKEDKLFDAAWKRYLEQLKKEGLEVDATKSQSGDSGKS